MVQIDAQSVVADNMWLWRADHLDGGVLVKNVSGLHPLLANCLRLTVGSPEQNRLMMDALRAAL